MINKKIRFSEIKLHMMISISVNNLRVVKFILIVISNPYFAVKLDSIRESKMIKQSSFLLNMV